MGLLWKEGSTTSQKIVAVVILLLAIGPLVTFFTHDFVPGSNVSSAAVFIAVVLTVFLIVLLINLYVKGRWKPAPAWQTYSWFKKSVSLLFMPFLIFGFLWVNIALSGPYLWTRMFGEQDIRYDVVVKNETHSRRSCDYSLEPRSIDVMFFKFCISKEQFNDLPDKEMSAKLNISRSSLGYIVESIQLYR